MKTSVSGISSKQQQHSEASAIPGAQPHSGRSQIKAVSFIRPFSASPLPPTSPAYDLRGLFSQVTGKYPV